MAGNKKGMWQFIVTLLIIGLGIAPAFAASNAHEHMSGADRPVWLEKLEKQIDYEEMMEGKNGLQERLNVTYRSLMDRLKGKLKEHASPASAGGH